MENDQTHALLISTIRKRAKNTRRLAQAFIVLIVVVVSLLIIYFSTSINTTFARMGGFSIGLLTPEIPYDTMASEEDTTIAAIKNLEKRIDKIEQKVISKSSFEADAAVSVGLTIIRIASAFLAVYLVQILVGFTRYQFRVADHLEATADSFEFSNGDIDSMSKIISSISPQHIEFGKTPKSPAEHSVDLLKELASKIPKH